LRLINFRKKLSGKLDGKKLFFLILISITLCACTSNNENKRILVASAGKIESLDPAQASTLRSLQIISALGDPLYRLNSYGELEPKLAKRLPEVSKDGLTINIPLREDVFFHDGTEFTSYAMAFSLKRFMRIGTQSYVIGGRIKTIETPNKYLIRLKLSRPSSSINGLLTSINLTPVSPKGYSNHKDQFLNNNFIGTGPYKLIGFKNEKQTLDPFSRYWGKRPNNQGIDYINFSNSSSLFGAIRNGEVDVLLSNSVDDGQRIALYKLTKKGMLREGLGPSIEIGYITLRSNLMPFNNRNIRKAISYSVNRNLLSEKVSYGIREPLRSIVPPILKDENISPWPKYNPKASRKLLKEEGYCKDKILTIPLTFRSNVPADKLLALFWKEQIKKDLSDCLKVEINGIESTTIYKQLSEGVYPAVILDWTGAYPDPESYLYPLLSCNEIDSDICKDGEAVFSGSFWGEQILQKALEDSEKLYGKERSMKLNEVEKLASNGSAYIPVWIVKPRAWSQLNISKPEFDGSGLLLLNLLKKNK
tara:strand:+ start:70684 stop:72285 length:1602 start_codon:yes stop_codon:yes gene_type:complete